MVGRAEGETHHIPRDHSLRSFAILTYLRTGTMAHFTRQPRDKMRRHEIATLHSAYSLENRQLLGRRPIQRGMSATGLSRRAIAVVP